MTVPGTISLVDALSAGLPDIKQLKADTNSFLPFAYYEHLTSAIKPNFKS